MSWWKASSILIFSLLAALCVTFAHSGSAAVGEVSVWDQGTPFWIGGDCKLTITRGEGNQIKFKVGKSSSTFVGEWPNEADEIKDQVKHARADNPNGPAQMEDIVLRFANVDGQILPVSYYHKNERFKNHGGSNAGTWCRDLVKKK